MGDESIDTLLTRWRASRSPELADVIQEIADPSGTEQGTPKALLDLWRTTNSRHGYDAFHVVKALPDDPRMTVMLMKCLFAARWPGSGATFLWTEIFARLVLLLDTRAIAALRRAAENLPHFTGIAHSKWMKDRISATADEIETACAELNLPLPKAPSPWLAELGVKTRTVTNIVETVWANPDDDATRLVAADALMEKGEPWGEFITLAFQIAEKEAAAVSEASDAIANMKKRAATLLHKHAQLFGGPIAFITKKDSWVFDKGFLASFSANRAQVARRRWDEAANAPHWATVRHVTLDVGDTPRWWISAIMKNSATSALRSIESSIHRRTLRLERATRSDPWVVTQASTETPLLSIFGAFIKGLDDAERKRVVIEKSLWAHEELEKIRNGSDKPKRV